MQAKLKEKLSGHFGKILWAQLFFLISFLPYFSQHPMRVHLLCAGALIASVFFAWYKRHLPLLGQILIVLIGGGFIFQHYQTFRGLEPGLSLLSFLVCVKMLELRSERDLFIIFFIISTLLVGHLLNIYDVLGLIHFLFCLAIMLLMMMCFHNKKSWIWPKKTHFKILGLLYLLAIPQAVILFIFFPRFYVGHLKFPSVGAQSKLGFTDKLRPGDVSSVVQDKSPIFRVRFNSKERPSTMDLYWRGAVLQETKGFNWDRGEAHIDKKFLEYYKSKESEFDHSSYKVDFATNDVDVAFTLRQTYGLKGLSRSLTNIEAGETFSIRPRSSQKISYKAKSLISKIDFPKYRAEDLKPYLQVPDIVSKKLKQYAMELRQSTPIEAKLVDKLMERYYQQDFTYTLSPGTYGGKSPIEDFFFERRRGFCEHYASVSALILRLAGIPSRVVTGFQGGLYNEYADYYILRGEDAHAWIEVYLQDGGWVRYDPTSYIAPERIELGASRYFQGLSPSDGSFDRTAGINSENSFLFKARLRWDAWYYEVNQFVMSYDRESQEYFLSQVGFPKFSPFELLSFTFAVVILLSLAGLALFSLNKKTVSQEERLWYKLLKYLEIQGLPKEPYLGPLKYRKKILYGLSSHQRQESILEVYDLLVILRYAPHTQDKKELISRVRQQLRQLK